MISKNINVEFEITPTELAYQFCLMDAEEQAEFINIAGRTASLWNRTLSFQLQAIVDTGKLNNYGKEFMRKIGDYSS